MKKIEDFRVQNPLRLMQLNLLSALRKTLVVMCRHVSNVLTGGSLSNIIVVSSMILVVDPCSDDSLNDCDVTSLCITAEDTDTGYECGCDTGYQLTDVGNSCIGIMYIYCRLLQ